MKKIYSTILLILFFCSCSEIFFNNEEQLIEYKLNEPFSKIDISGIFNITLVQDSANKIIITGSNNIDLITYNITEETLHIDDGKKFSLNTNKNNLEIHFTSLSFLVTRDPVNLTNKDTIRAYDLLYYGIGEICEVNLTLNTTNFKMDNSANTLGHFYFKGETENCSFFNRYGSSIFAGELICKNAVIYNESVGDIYINPEKSLKVCIWGPGNIYYYRNPEIEIIENTSSGKVLKK